MSKPFTRIGVLLLIFLITGFMLILVRSWIQQTPTASTTTSSSTIEAVEATPTSTSLPRTELPISTLTSSSEASAGTAPQSPLDSPAPPVMVEYTYKVLNSYPHDPQAFTQGLVYHEGMLYEGTGLNGRSSLRLVKLETGEVVQKVALPSEYFGEGIAFFDGQIIQLTWQSKVGFLWQASDTFEKIGQFTYPTEGWGITHDGEQLYMSDGSDTIFLWDTSIFSIDANKDTGNTNISPTELGQIQVRANGQPVARLNELEWVEGELYANVWQTDEIVRIDPATGNVTGRIDLTGLLPSADRPGADVLNGIAYDDATDRLFITGKLWPKLFEIEVLPK